MKEVRLVARIEDRTEASVKVMKKIIKMAFIKRLPLSLSCMWIIIVLGWVMPCGIRAQNGVSFERYQKGTVVDGANLELSCNKTCMLIFPAAIQSADRGAAYVLASRVQGSENALKVKAGKAGFEPSSLTVITKDGQVYAFNVSYKAKPAYLVLDFSRKQKNKQLHEGDCDLGRLVKTGQGENGKITDQPDGDEVQEKSSAMEVGTRRFFENKGGKEQKLEQKLEQEQDLKQDLKPVLEQKLEQKSANGGNRLRTGQLPDGPLGPVQFSGVRLNAAELSRCMDKINRDAAFIQGVQTNRFGVDFKLEGVYFYKEVLFFKFRLHNRAGIPFKVESLRLFIRDNKKARRTAVQDQELESLAIKSWGLPEFNNDSGEDADGQQIMLAVPRFTIADDKQLAVILREVDGDRNLLLKVRERKLRKTRMLNQ